MPRTPVERNPLFVELSERLARIESANNRTIEAAENAAKKARANLRYQKAVAILQTVESGLSVYAAAKAAGIKSSLGRTNLIADCDLVVMKFEQEWGSQNG